MPSDRDLITSNPEEWEKVTEGIGTIPDPLWQHRDDPNIWSIDGGKTFYSISEVVGVNGAPRIYNSKEYTRAQ